MPYCRRCGTKLDEDAHFCHKCGTPVAVFIPVPAAPIKPVRPIRKEPFVIAAIVLIVLLISAVIVSAILFAPASTLNFDQTNQDSHPNVDTLNLNLQADSAQVNIITQKINDQNILISTSATGSRSIFGSTNFVTVTFSNDTENNVLTVNTKVTDTTGSFISNRHVICTVYVNPALNLNLNVTTQTGKITLTSQTPATFQSLNLHTNAGAVEATLQNATISGNFTLQTQAGTVYFGSNQANVLGNQTVELHSNAGSINMDITQTKTLQGNLQINSVTDLGSVTVGLQLDGAVGAKIVSQTNLGSIHPNVQHFSGNQSPIQSDNYPAASNIEINCRTNLGSININAIYSSSTSPSIRN